MPERAGRGGSGQCRQKPQGQNQLQRAHTKTTTTGDSPLAAHSTSDTADATAAAHGELHGSKEIETLFK